MYYCLTYICIYIYIYIWDWKFEHIILLLLTWLITWFNINLGANNFLYQKLFIVLPSFFSIFWVKNYFYFFINHFEIWYLILGFGCPNLKAISFFTICLFYVNFHWFLSLDYFEIFFYHWILSQFHLLFYMNAIYNSYLDISVIPLSLCLSRLIS